MKPFFFSLTHLEVRGQTQRKGGGRDGKGVTERRKIGDENPVRSLVTNTYIG